MFPDFLCIGAQKAGTTWLYRNVKQHPDVWMPPRKEVHYFDDILPLPLIVSVFNPATFWQRKLVLGRLLKPGKPADIQNRRWYLRFLLLPRTDSWYKSLFLPSKGRITGDITPAYAIVKKSRVAKARALMPDTKIIYLLRNPIHRAWSQAAMHFENWWGQSLQATKDERITWYLDRESHRKHSDYLSNLGTWERFFPQYQFYVGFFDQLITSPRDFLQDIYRFLGLDASEQVIPQTVHEKRNVGRYPTMPDHIAHYLASQYHGQIEQLHRRFDNCYTAEWLDFAKRHL